jgi:hypothetical protein
MINRGAQQAAGAAAVAASAKTTDAGWGKGADFLPTRCIGKHTLEAHYDMHHVPVSYQPSNEPAPIIIHCKTTRSLA